MRALQILIFLIPFQNHPLLSMNILPRLTPIKIAGIVAVLTIIFQTKKVGTKVPMAMPESLFLFWVALELFLSTFWFPTVGADSVRSFISFLMFYFVVKNKVDNTSDVDAIYRACMIAMAWSSFYMFKEYFQLRHTYNGFRPKGSFGDSNYYSIAAVVVMPMCISLLNRAKSYKRFLIIGCISAIAGGVLVGQSRGGIIGMVILGFLYWLNSKKKIRGIALSLLLCGIAAAFVPANFWDRLSKNKVSESTDLSGDDLSNKRRVELPRAGFLMYKANPIFGVGPGNYKENSAVHNPILWDLQGPGVAHNTFLEVLGETGTVGMILFIGILLGLIRTLNKVMNSHSGNINIYSQALALKISLYVYSFTAFFLSAQFSKFYWLIIFVGIAVQKVSKIEEAMQIKSSDLSQNALK